MKKLLLALALSSASVCSFAAIRYVNILATGANTGSSWVDAFTSVQSALVASLVGDTIWVAAGVYKPTTTTSRTVSFEIPSGVAVYGGFNGTESNIVQRNIMANPTILSGDIGVAGLMTDNSYHVVKMTNVANTTTLDGFGITEGYANGTGIGGQDKGGGLLNAGGSATVSNCTFLGNYAEFSGGALSHTGSGEIVVTNSHFSFNNSLSFGGAVYLGPGTAHFINCDLSENSSASNGGAAHFDGGNVNMDRCILSGNVAAGIGGAMFSSYSTTATVTNSLIVGNKAYTVSASYLPGTTGVNGHHFINCTVAHNQATSVGIIENAITINDVSSVRNCIIWENSGPYQVSTTSPHISNNIIMGGAAFNGSPIPGNILLDPDFVGPATIVAAPFNASAYNYKVAIGSAAINAGVNAWLPSPATLDLDGANRFFGTSADIGAYEHTYCPLTTSITTNGPVCEGDTLTLTATGGNSFLWSNATVGASTQVTVADTYAVAATDNAGCWGTDTVVASFLPLPQPAMVANGGILSTTQSYVTYQWLKDGIVIPGATNASYTPSLPGDYTVLVTGNNGCSGSSSPFTFTPVSVEEVLNGGMIAYPNPAQDMLYLSLESGMDWDIVITSMDGKVVLQRKVVHGQVNGPVAVDIRTWQTGIYMVKCVAGNLLIRQKLLKIK